MDQVQNVIPVRRFGETSRLDNWWLEPLVVFIGLSTFVVYSTWAALQGEHYYSGPYLSPFYSPEIFGESSHSLFGPRPVWWPSWLPFSPAILILWAPVGFRMTCYYYRGAYYKAFWADPISCSVGEPRNIYLGENSFPLLIQNIHRYLLPFAFALLVFLSIDAWKALWFEDPLTGVTSFGIGIGSIILTLNVILLSSYTLGCHSLRHIVGGRKDCISDSPAQTSMYNCVTCFNKRHMLCAWLSLVCVGFSDIYVRMCSMGVWTDFRIL